MTKVTKEFLESEIVNVEYQRGPGTITHCYITVKNGFTFTGESACVSEANFDEEIGKKYAYEQAFEKMWHPYGFLLKSKLGADSPLARMEIEYDELVERISKLSVFLNKGKPDFLNDDEWALMKEQLEHMTEYSAVLKIRIDIAIAKLNGTAKK